MATAKAKKFGTYRHAALGVAIPMYLDTKTMEFSIEVAPGELITGKDGSKVQKQANKRVEELYELKFIPVASVSIRRQSGGGVEVKAHRLRIARAFDGRVITQAWAADSEDQKTVESSTFICKQIRLQIKDTPNMEEALPMHGKGGIYHSAYWHHILPYNDLMWESIKSIEDDLAVVNRNLQSELASGNLSILAAMAERLVAAAAGLNRMVEVDTEPTIEETEMEQVV